VVSGRPVAFVGAAPDEALAIQRYGEAYRRIGILDPAYVYEPVGAAYYYAQRLTADALVLVCDFGGGTSDFSLIRFERRGNRYAATPIGHAGLAVAGDNFDSRIIDEVVSPRLGKGTLFKSIDKILPIPQHYHASLARWHQLAMLKTPEYTRELERLQRASLSPDKIAKFPRGHPQRLGVQHLSRGIRYQGDAVRGAARRFCARARRHRYRAGNFACGFRELDR
jgi:hypothetical chaperone protein